MKLCLLIRQFEKIYLKIKVIRSDYFENLTKPPFFCKVNPEAIPLELVQTLQTFSKPGPWPGQLQLRPDGTPASDPEAIPGGTGAKFSKHL